jgi:uncharacterized protein
LDTGRLKYGFPAFFDLMNRNGLFLAVSAVYSERSVCQTMLASGAAHARSVFCWKRNLMAASPAPTHPELIFDGAEKALHTIVLAHGAGAGMRSPFLQAFAEGLAVRGFRVARFEFPYMAGRRAGRRGPPDPLPVLKQTWLRVIELVGPKGLVIGGKSMGGRIASLVADEAAVRGLVCLGYPFHPTGKPESLRVEHLQTIGTPTLILQGTRDPFGNQEEVRGYQLSSSIRVHWLEDGDHNFKPRARSGRTEQGNWQEALEQMAAFVKKLD